MNSKTRNKMFCTKVKANQLFHKSFDLRFEKAKAKLQRESMTEKDKQREKEAENIKKSGRARFNCEFKCMDNGDRSIDGELLAKTNGGLCELWRRAVQS